MPRYRRYRDYSVESKQTVSLEERIHVFQARRGELESLDLAVERQKSSLRLMKETEKSLLSEREAATKELKNLRKNRTREEKRK